jgi:hypothetical protein
LLLFVPKQPFDDKICIIFPIRDES